MDSIKHNQFTDSVKLLYRKLVVLISILMIFVCMLFYVMIDPNFSAFKQNNAETDYVANNEDEDWDKIENGIHLRTGFVEGEGLMETVNNCTGCHSAKLVTQNRMSKERWAATIDWMQKTQNLWDLGPNEEIIINYLVTNYPVQKKGRRKVLTNIEWYELED